MTVGDDGGIDVVTTQVLRARPAARHRDPVPPRRPEPSCARRSGARSATARPTATVTGAIPGAPVDADGHRGAGPGDNGGSRLEFKATVEVRIPLVGGKIENFIGSQLVDLLIAEQRFTTVWITENA